MTYQEKVENQLVSAFGLERDAAADLLAAHAGEVERFRQIAGDGDESAFLCSLAMSDYDYTARIAAAEVERKKNIAPPPGPGP